MSVTLRGRLEPVYKGGPLNISVSIPLANDPGIDFLSEYIYLFFEKEDTRVILVSDPSGTGSGTSTDDAEYTTDGTNQTLTFSKTGEWTIDDNNLPSGCYQVYIYMKTFDVSTAIVIPLGNIDVIMPESNTGFTA